MIHWNMTTTVLMLAAYLLTLPAAAQTQFIPIDSRATYLRTNGDSNALAAVLVDLQALSFPVVPGDHILLERVGDYSPFTAFGDAASSMLGIFSSSVSLLPSGNLGRVVDAIDAGTDFVTAPTGTGGLPTDIPQDFAISAPSGTPPSVVIRVPVSARYLFVSPHDSFFGENTDPNGNYGLRISRVQAVPGLASGPLGLGGICVALAFALWRGVRSDDALDRD